MAAVIVGFFSMLANLSLPVFVPLLLVEENGLSLAAAGLVLTPGAAVLVILSPLAGRLSDRAGARPVVFAGLVVMGLSTLFLSTVAGAPPVSIAVGMLGVGAGFAFVQSPANNAAANALPEEGVGAGMGVFAGAFFLGAGTGPAVVGAFLAARQEGAFGPLSPLHAFGAAPFSDAFLAIVPALILALIAAFGLQGCTRANERRGDTASAKRGERRTTGDGRA